MDWYISFPQICHDFKIDKIIPSKKSKILELGCGNSNLSADLNENGYENITSLDFSHIIIKRMKEKYFDKNINCKIKILEIISSCLWRFFEVK